MTLSKRQDRAIDTLVFGGVAATFVVVILFFIALIGLMVAGAWWLIS